jgi:hypothetical protein
MTWRVADEAKNNSAGGDAMKQNKTTLFVERRLPF